MDLLELYSLYGNQVRESLGERIVSRDDSDVEVEASKKAFDLYDDFILAVETNGAPYFRHGEVIEKEIDVFDFGHFDISDVARKTLGLNDTRQYSYSYIRLVCESKELWIGVSSYEYSSMDGYPEKIDVVAVITLEQLIEFGDAFRLLELVK